MTDKIKHEDTFQFPEVIKSEGEWVRIKPIENHPGYGAGENGYVYSFYDRPAGGFSYLNMPYKLSRYLLGISKRGKYSLEHPELNYDAATLIANAWNIEGDGEIVGFLDGNRDNCSVANLKWMTYSENIKLVNPRIGELSNSAKLTEDNVRIIRELRGFMKLREVAEMFHVCRGTVRDIWGGKHWRHLGPLPESRMLFCKMCGKGVEVLYTGHGNWKFCSQKCKSAWGYRDRYVGHCFMCGKKFSFSLHRQRTRIMKGLPVFCSYTCRQTHNSRKRYGTI